MIDDRRRQRQPTVCTARTGLQHLRYRGEPFCRRLTSRLAAGLVIALEPLQPAGRLLLLENLAKYRQLALPHQVLTWLADNLSGGGRQLEGAIHQLKFLARLHHQPLDVATVAAHLREQVDAGKPTVERIALRVSRYFRVAARQLQSRRRYRNILLPRQVGMYLARRLTGLSLEQIGAYFGGRDHSTVLGPGGHRGRCRTLRGRSANPCRPRLIEAPRVGCGKLVDDLTKTRWLMIILCRFPMPSETFALWSTKSDRPSSVPAPVFHKNTLAATRARFSAGGIFS